MKVYIIDRNQKKLKYAKLYFYDMEEVECVSKDLHTFLSSNYVEGIVSPANSYGLMDGGFDLAITKHFGDQLQKRVQKYIIHNFYGEQPVGTSFIIDAGKDNQFLIHTPTMRTPQKIRDPLVIYQCMRTSLMCALENNIESLLVPLFGGECGMIHPKIIAEMMWKAYIQIKNPPQSLNWRYAQHHEIVCPEKIYHEFDY